MKNNRHGDLTSFELLLDTMCNTFGGIIFIALLLTILSQTIGNNKPHDIVKNTDDQHEAPIDSSEHHYDPDDLATLLEGNELLKDTNDQIETAIYDIRKKIDRVQESRNRTLRLPRLHPVAKKPVFLAVSGGKLYAISDVSGKYSSKNRDYDKSDVRVRESVGYADIDLVKGKGQVIKVGAENSGKFKQAITNIDPNNEFISFAVYKDSFAEFNYIKTIFINIGFSYSFHIIIKDNFVITYTSRGAEAL